MPRLSFTVYRSIATQCGENAFGTEGAPAPGRTLAARRQRRRLLDQRGDVLLKGGTKQHARRLAPRIANYEERGLLICNRYGEAVSFFDPYNFPYDRMEPIETLLINRDPR